MWIRGGFPGPALVGVRARGDLCELLKGSAFDRCRNFMPFLDSGIDQASGCRLTFQDHARVVSFDGDAYRGSEGVMVVRSVSFG